MYHISSESELDKFIVNLEDYSDEELEDILEHHHHAHAAAITEENWFAADIYGDVCRVAHRELFYRKNM